MHLPGIHPIPALLACLLLGSLQAHADGLADLKAALSRLQGQMPLKAALEIKTSSRQGDGKEAEDRQGQASLTLEDSSRGLQLLYGKDILTRAENEQRANSKDKNSKTPTLYALRALDFTELRSMTSAATALAREIEDSTYKGETADTYNGKPARKLTFEKTIDKLAERDRKYVKDFEGRLTIWIATDGTPLASTMRLNLSGRAFIVVSFEQQSDEDRSYSVVGDRLVLIRKEEKNRSSGAGERQENKSSMVLQPLT
ncbi:hypothetical protein QWZ03_14860 [Chitinimonas viridis]|uniref:Uncharacterized protein n=1 Tax=Chitinimonas viridis TaxID=664880 RepID=A0ABT8B7C1_9NEIS|nr:hypothetical protein [Chitinimonas viridis]MDN3578046.1 hypothetical protein [Chitinimonas viridis]